MDCDQATGRRDKRTRFDIPRIQQSGTRRFLRLNRIGWRDRSAQEDRLCFLAQSSMSTSTLNQRGPPSFISIDGMHERGLPALMRHAILAPKGHSHDSPGQSGAA